MKISNAGYAVLSLLDADYEVLAEPLKLRGEYKAVCEYLPAAYCKISVLRALQRRGLVDCYENIYSALVFTMTTEGKRVFSICAPATKGQP